MRPPLLLLLLHLWGIVEDALSQNACSTVPRVLNGYVSDETRKAEYQVGDLIHFTCEIGYISGLTIRYVCKEEGWTAIYKGRCYLRPCQLPDDTPNGYYQIIHGADFVYGTTIKYFCNEGYQMVSKDDTRTCLLEKWTNHVPICESLSCDHPPPDPEITVNGLQDNEDQIRPDRFLRFSCDGPGKRLNGSSVLICGKDGQWNDRFPSCEDISCDVDAMHPHLSADGLPLAGETVKSGQRLQFRCGDGYSMEGSEEVWCRDTGKWSAPFPTCSEACRVTGVPAGVRLRTHVPGNRLTKGQKLRFQCAVNGQFLQGKAEVECLENGQWSGPFPTCRGPLGCGQPPSLMDGDTKETAEYRYAHNERVEYICQNLYTMQGEPFKTCHNGEWTGAMRCLKPCTVEQEAMRRNNIAFAYSQEIKLYSRHNHELSFACTRGGPYGGVAMRQRCIDGVMTLPTCQ